MLLRDLRQRIVEVGQEALATGIVHGTAGNFSERDAASGLIGISPSGIPYLETRIEDVVIVDLEGIVVDGARRPSSETPMHTMVFREFPEIVAILHTHSHFSTVVSTIRPYLPPILTEICLVVGRKIPVTRYGLTGLDDIGKSVVEVMDHETKAVIMKNHGLITFGQSFAEAMLYAMIVEESARVYVHALAANCGREPDLVPETLIDEMTERFLASYGQPANESSIT